MLNFICPVCKSEISLFDRIYKCPYNHCFDVSKDGYVNLLMSQQSSLKRHGDDKLMVKARRDFLDAGYYAFLCENLCGICLEYLPDGGSVLDAGCGTDAPGSYIAWLCQQTTVHAMEMPGRRYDIGNLESYEKVKAEYMGIAQSSAMQ